MKLRLSIVVMAAIAAGCASLALPSGASAQECGSWPAPVLCQAELRLMNEGWQGERLDPRRPLSLALDSDIEIEVQGRDQFGRTFPAYRLALDFDNRDCSRLLEVESRGEGRLRISVGRSEGRCRLDVWVPGNLNFEWRLDLEIAKPARVGYERSEAEQLAHGLYRALLARDPDEAGYNGAVMELQRGNLEAQVTAMVRSAEFQQTNLMKDSGALLDQFYRGLYGRAPDSAGIRTYLDDMQRRRYVDVILGLVRAPEYEDLLVRIR